MSGFDTARSSSTCDLGGSTRVILTCTDLNPKKIRIGAENLFDYEFLRQKTVERFPDLKKQMSPETTFNFFYYYENLL